MSLPTSEVIDISCNWKVSNGKEVEFEELVTLDTCVALARDGLESTELPEIALKLKSPGARTLELYVGHSKQYSGTTKAVDSEAGDDELKFAGLGSGDMWLLALGVALKPASSQQQSMAAVEQLLAGTTLSPGAEQCRRMVLAQTHPQPQMSEARTLQDLEASLSKRMDDFEARLMNKIESRIDEMQATLISKLGLSEK
ncbi:hypothetical protein B566_EDAN015990 [Ephemera danica]|nr:hypothetical protein B566_EDAN015990 [Ephemera danica]